jgi:hypothetical protein
VHTRTVLVVARSSSSASAHSRLPATTTCTMDAARAWSCKCPAHQYTPPDRALSPSHPSVPHRAAAQLAVEPVDDEVRRQCDGARGVA